MSEPAAAIKQIDSSRKPVEAAGATRTTITSRGLSRTSPSTSSSFLKHLVDELLHKPGDTTQVYEVQKGDTLSGICQKLLKEHGRTATRVEINSAVKAVAQANHLQSPDKIYAGQKLDLASAVAGTDIVAQGGRAAPWRPSLHDLTAVMGLIEEKLAGESPPVEVARLGIVEAATVTSQFGVRLNPFSGRPERHEGVDLAAPRNTPVHAAMPGTVVFSGWQPGYGKTVIIRHTDGTETLYAHNAVNLVHAGQKVDSSMTIAKVGSTGDSTGPHVHFELRKGGRAVDPAGIREPASGQVAQAPQRVNVVL